MKSDPKAILEQPNNPSRRQWLGSTSLLVASSAILPLSGAIAGSTATAAVSTGPSASEIDGFHELGMLLTARHDLPLDISQRLLQALSRDDAQFLATSQRLAQALAAAGITDINHYPGSSVAQDQALHACAMKIISGWYLGYTGTPVSLSDTDDTQFITYTGALMYERTREVTVIPTYSRAGTDYWHAPPPVIADA